MDAKKIGQKLVELRGEKTQEAVAIDLKISRSAVQMYENGERIPRDEIKIKIANYFNVNVQSIFFD
jgi:DNA-binding XRE family transcriptional regulator